MITKQCKRCLKELPADTGFYLSDNSCKECRKAMVRENRAKNIEYYREYDNARANRPDRVKARIEYAKTPQGIEASNKAKKKWTEMNAKKRAVANVVNNAIRDGKIKKPSSCQACKKSECRIEGYHEDYDKPLNIEWLCSSCHRKWHKKNGSGKNA